MKRIDKIDKNFASHTVQYEGMKVFRIDEEPFKVYGLIPKEEGGYIRMPQEVADVINPSVKELNKCTSGGRVCFRTNSKQIIVSSILPNVCNFPHMPLTGSSCFDLYADGEYVDVFRPDFLDEKKKEIGRYDATLYFASEKEREIVIYFPLYNEVRDVVIAIEEGAVLLPPKVHCRKPKIAYYGSSITQGGCASHPGNSYPAMISRRLDCDYVNFGFSAGCYGEEEMANYLADYDMDILVYDYDHNAGDINVLKNTHKRFLDIIRNKRPNLPIIIVSAADRFLGLQEERRKVIRNTYQKALVSGDTNIYFVDGKDIYADVGVDYCTVDAIHPNDLGFWCMAKQIGNVIEKIICDE